IEVCPILGDFSQFLTLPPRISRCDKTGFFRCSSIANFEHREAAGLLGHCRGLLSAGGRLSVAADLKKDTHKLVRAYDDSAGVTATVNRNLLTRINRELKGTFDLAAFRHRAVYNADEGRIEMHLESMRDQEVLVGGRRLVCR